MALGGRKEVGCTSGSGGGTVDDKAGEGDERDARESSPETGRRLRGGKLTGRKETGCKETGRKTMRAKETGGDETGAKALGAQYSQEMGGKGDTLTGKREMDNMLPGDTTGTECDRRNLTQVLH